MGDRHAYLYSLSGLLAPAGANIAVEFNARRESRLQALPSSLRSTPSSVDPDQLPFSSEATTSISSDVGLRSAGYIKMQWFAAAGRSRKPD